jgi:hypothetical protein
MIMKRHAAHIGELRKEHNDSAIVQAVTDKNSTFLLDAIGIKI